MLNNLKIIAATCTYATLIFSFSSCGSRDTISDTDVNEAKLYGRYDGSYDPNTNKLSFYVQFRVGGSTGTTVRLSDQGRLKVGNDILAVVDGDVAAINLKGTYYKLDYTTSAPLPEYVISWTRTDGSTYENKMSIPKPVTVTTPAEGFALKAGDDFPFVISSDALGANESLDCALVSESSPESNSLWTTCPVGGTSTIAGIKTARLPTGPASAYATLQRRSRVPLGHEAIGGFVQTASKSLIVKGSITAD